MRVAAAAAGARGGHRWSRRTAAALAVLAPFGALVVLWLRWLGFGSDGGATLLPGALLMSTAFTAVALVVLHRQPGNGIAWLFLVVGVGIPVSMALLHGGAAMLRLEVAGGVWVLLVGVVLGEIAWPLLWLIPHFFPNGRPAPGRFWAVLAWASVAAASTAGILIGLDPAGLHDWDDEPVAANPVGVTALAGVWDDLSDSLGLFMRYGVMVGGVASLIWRWWRSAPEQRRQLAAFVMALPVCMGVMLATRGLTGWPQVVLVTVAMVGLPVALGIAVLRYRLYELDRVLSRALSYGVLTAVLAGLYVSAVTAATRLLPVSSTTGIVLATLACAAAFHPLRRRLQAVVDARFNPVRARSRERVDAFSDRLRDELAPEDVAAELAAAVRGAVGARSVAVWLAPVEQSRSSGVG